MSALCPLCAKALPLGGLDKHLRRELRYSAFACRLCSNAFFTLQDARFHFAQGESHALGTKVSILEDRDMEVEERIAALVKRAAGGGAEAPEPCVVPEDSPASPAPDVALGSGLRSPSSPDQTSSPDVSTTLGDSTIRAPAKEAEEPMGDLASFIEPGGEETLRRLRSLNQTAYRSAMRGEAEEETVVEEAVEVVEETNIPSEEELTVLNLTPTAAPKTALASPLPFEATSLTPVRLLSSLPQEPAPKPQPASDEVCILSTETQPAPASQPRPVSKAWDKGKKAKPTSDEVTVIEVQVAAAKPGPVLKAGTGKAVGKRAARCSLGPAIPRPVGKRRQPGLWDCLACRLCKTTVAADAWLDHVTFRHLQNTTFRCDACKVTQESWALDKDLEVAKCPAKGGERHLMREAGGGELLLVVQDAAQRCFGERIERSGKRLRLATAE